MNPRAGGEGAVGEAMKSITLLRLDNGKVQQRARFGSATRCGLGLLRYAGSSSSCRLLVGDVSPSAWVMVLTPHFQGQAPQTAPVLGTLR